MLRINTTPRADWQKKLEDLSFEYHSLGASYWDEGHYYQFTMEQVLKIEKATNDLWRLCLAAVQHVIDNKLYHKLCIDPSLIPMIESSWENETASIYARFDLMYDGKGEPKMLEINADTPTSLYETAVIQWYWLKDIGHNADQFNSVHEKILDYWKSLLADDYMDGRTLHFTCLKDNIEDFTTVEYLRDLASQAGLKTRFVYIEDIGWDALRSYFLDEINNPIEMIFKLYPWEWLIAEEYGQNMQRDRKNCEWMEPAWKAVLSNKGILPILWQLNPGHPNLLPAYYDNPHDMRSFVSKPIYSREGANVTIVINGEVITRTGGEYGEEGFIYQEYAEGIMFEDDKPIIGSWIIGGESAGMCIRESNGLVTDNLSRFIPHLIG